jgi:hypothetical protein
LNAVVSAAFAIPCANRLVLLAPELTDGKNPDRLSGQVPPIDFSTTLPRFTSMTFYTCHLERASTDGRAMCPTRHAPAAALAARVDA